LQNVWYGLVIYLFIVVLLVVEKEILALSGVQLVPQKYLQEHQQYYKYLAMHTIQQDQYTLIEQSSLHNIQANIDL